MGLKESKAITSFQIYFCYKSGRNLDVTLGSVKTFESSSLGLEPSLALTSMWESLRELQNSADKPILQSLQTQAQKLDLLLQNKTAKKSSFIQ